MSQDAGQRRARWLYVIFGLAFVSGVASIGFGGQRGWFIAALALVGLWQARVLGGRNGRDSSSRARAAARTLVPLTLLAALALWAGLLAMARFMEGDVQGGLFRLAIVLVNLVLMGILVRRSLRRPPGDDI